MNKTEIKIFCFQLIEMRISANKQKKIKLNRAMRKCSPVPDFWQFSNEFNISGLRCFCIEDLVGENVQ